jgi:hypothetical protein
MIKKMFKSSNKLYYLNDENIWGIKPEVKRDSLANQPEDTQESWRLNINICIGPYSILFVPEQIRLYRNGRKVWFFSVD